MIVCIIALIISFVFGYLVAALLRASGTQDLIQELVVLKKNYYELLNQIEMKYPNSTRHETALHYLRSYQKLFKRTRKRGNNGKNINDQKS